MPDENGVFGEDFDQRLADFLADTEPVDHGEVEFPYVEKVTITRTWTDDQTYALRIEGGEDMDSDTVSAILTTASVCLHTDHLRGGGQ